MKNITIDTIMKAVEKPESDEHLNVQQIIDSHLISENKIKLIGLTKQEISKILEIMGEKPFRANQIWAWVYNRGVTDFLQMSNISKESQQKLSNIFEIERPKISSHQISSDGTQKWLLMFPDGSEVETVFIPEVSSSSSKKFGALCISSQVGCTLTCKFCHTGTQKWVRNLTPGEILQQVMIARDYLNEWPSTQETRKIANIVLMGMGEPLFNYDNVARAMKIIMDDNGISISRKRITLSTSGVANKIEQCGRELGINLALSLHATTDELRDVIVPLNKKFKIKELLAICKKYQQISKSKRITFEYVMLKNINDSIEDAERLVRMLSNIPSTINLIPFNPWPGTIYECSEDAVVKKFAKILTSKGLICTVRTPRGRDILAACGQLKSASEKQKKACA